MACLAFTLEQGSVQRHLKKGLISSISCPQFMSCRSRLAKPHLSRPFLSSGSRGSACRGSALGHGGLLQGALDCNYNRGKSEGLSMCSVGNGLIWVWFFFPTICLIPVVAQPPVIFHREMPKRCSGCYFGRYRVKQGGTSSSGGVCRRQGCRDSCAAVGCDTV